MARPLCQAGVNTRKKIVLLFVCIQKGVLLGMHSSLMGRYSSVCLSLLVTNMWWIHSIMPSTSGGTNGWVFDSRRLNTETFGHSISWLFLSTQFCCFTLSSRVQPRSGWSTKGWLCHWLNRSWPKGIPANVHALILTAGWCNVDRSWCYLALEGSHPCVWPRDETGPFHGNFCIFCSFLPLLDRKQQRGWGDTGPAPLYFQPLASAS